MTEITQASNSNENATEIKEIEEASVENTEKAKNGSTESFSTIKEIETTEEKTNVESSSSDHTETVDITDASGMLETVESTIHEAEKIAENETVATESGIDNTESDELTESTVMAGEKEDEKQKESGIGSGVIKGIGGVDKIAEKTDENQQNNDGTDMNLFNFSFSTEDAPLQIGNIKVAEGVELVEDGTENSKTEESKNLFAKMYDAVSSKFMSNNSG